MIRRNFARIILPVGVLSVGQVFCQTNKVKDNSKNVRPNIVVIYLDDMDNSMAGCYGGYANTPNIDKLAENGMRFTRYYPSSSVSQPSRYSLLTGKYASRNQSENFVKDSKQGNQAFVRWNTDIADTDITIAEVMKTNEYNTGFVGKWHLGFPNYNPTALSGDADPSDIEVKNFLKDNYLKTLKHVRDVSGFDEVLNLYSINIRWIPVPDTLDHHNQEWLTQGSVDFLEAASRIEKPFLLYLATTLPHIPSTISSLEATPCTPLGFTKKSGIQASRKSVMDLTQKQNNLSQLQKEHFAAMKWIDDGIGVIMDKIKKLGIEDNTLIILASDNDERAKMSCYDGKVPLIVQWKGKIKGGQVCEELVSNIDFAPTIYDLCGIDVQEGAVLDGKSLRPLFLGETKGWRESLFLEILYTRGIVTKTHNYVAIRYPQIVMDKITIENRKEYNQEGTKISQNDGVTVEEITGEHVRYNTNINYPAYYDFDQLYDLEKDPLEQKNLAYDKNYELELMKMKKMLKEYSKNLPNSFGEFK